MQKKTQQRRISKTVTIKQRPSQIFNKIYSCDVRDILLQQKNNKHNKEIQEGNQCLEIDSETASNSKLRISVQWKDGTIGGAVCPGCILVLRRTERE